MSIFLSVIAVIVQAVSPSAMPNNYHAVNIVYASQKNTLASSVLAVVEIPDVANAENGGELSPQTIVERTGGVVVADEDRAGTSYNELGRELERETIISLIQQAFGQDWRIMAKVADCESQLKPQAKNKHSTAKGIFQILDGTWEHFKCEGDVLNAEDNIACGKKILDGQGLGGGWQESFQCWKNM